MIDYLSYEYFHTTYKNRLRNVKDRSNNPEGFSQGTNTSTQFSYDSDGNLIKDTNKKITNIVYNHLGLPTKIEFEENKKIEYQYDASGVKLYKKVYANTALAPEVTTYRNGFQYTNGVLQFFPHAEGYVNVTDNGTFEYIYNYSDHLGNVRLSYKYDQTASQTNNLTIVDANNYYPFGLKHKGINSPNLNQAYKYKYNGKELQDELGLNLYDYGARNYDPAIGRWMNVDPLAEQTMTPYQYVNNNPIMFTDPTGMSAEGPGDGLGPKGAPVGEIVGNKDGTKYLEGDGNGVKVMAPDGKYHSFNSKIIKYTYSDGKFHNGQQKKEGVWSVTNKEGNFLWDNSKCEFVKNESDRGGGENSFPSLGKMGTTYAGGDNPGSKNGNGYDYSQPPQNIADFVGKIHDKDFDNRQLEGFKGALSPLSTPANKRLIYLSKLVILMYKKGKIDPFTGAPVSKLTHDIAVNMIRAFEIIEASKK